MSADETTGTGTSHQSILQKRHQLNNTITLAYGAESNHGFVPAGIRQDLRTDILAYAEELEDYRTETAIQHDWPEDGLDWIKSLATQTVRDYEPAPGDTDNQIPIEKPAIHTADWRRMVAVARRLKRIGKDLGFAAEAKETTPNGEADMDDLAGLLKTRGQEDALENLPVGDD